MGMDLDPELAFTTVAALVKHAVAANTFVRIDMEGSEYTHATIDQVCRLHAMEGHRARGRRPAKSGPLGARSEVPTR
jgi:proline dehydrogenase